MLQLDDPLGDKKAANKTEMGDQEPALHNLPFYLHSVIQKQGY
jgi:hypothetical protein